MEEEDDSDADEYHDAWEFVVKQEKRENPSEDVRPTTSPAPASEGIAADAWDRPDEEPRSPELRPPFNPAPTEAWAPVAVTRHVARKQYMKPNRFDGTGSFESFLKQFEVCAGHNQWTEKEKIDFLQVSLEKSAAQLLWDFGSTARVTYDDLITRLRQRYGLAAQKETFRVQLRYRRQREKETLAELLHDIRRLVALAYPNPHPEKETSEVNETNETVACDAFLEAMYDQELSLKVREREPRTLDEVFRTAVRLEAYRNTFDANGPARERFRPGQRHVRSSTEEEQSSDLAGQMKDFMAEQKKVQTEWMKDVEAKILSRTPPVTASRNERPAFVAQQPPVPQRWEPVRPAAPVVDGRAGDSSQQRPPIRCFNCHELGHVKRNCRRPPNRDPNRKSTNSHSSKAASELEKVSGAYVNAVINEQRCLCLIDTGADTNLLPATLAKGCRLQPARRKLTAANGSAIHVAGEVTLPVTFRRGCRRDVTFVVSRQVSEVMLGMEFIEANKFELSLSKGKMFLGRCEIPLVRKNGVKWCRRISVREETTIPPRTQVDVASRVLTRSRKNMKSVAWMAEHRELQPGVHLARAVFDNPTETVMVRIVNVNDEPVTLWQDDQLGELWPVDLVGGGRSTRTTGNRVSGEELLARMDCDAPEEVRGALTELLEDYRDVFSSEDSDLGYCTVTRHRIDTGNARPVRQPLRPHARAHREAVDEHVEAMLRNDLIEPAQSEWASNVVLAKKKDGSLRFCLDYRGLNAVTKGDAYPLPKIVDCLDALGGAGWFSTLDLRSGYHQIGMDPTDADKTAFVTRRGTFRWRRMPMGLTGATATFQRTMDLILSGLNFISCLVYLDDVICFSTTPQQHVDRLREIFDRLRKANLKLKVQKCRLLKKRVEFLGHVISPDGVSADPEKIQKVVDWNPPRCLKELRAFLGLCSYYRRFVSDFARVAAPLNTLTKKDCPFVWNGERQEAFEELKRKLTSSPILGLPADEGEYILDTDASDTAIGAVLSQRQNGIERVLAYGSRRLSSAEKNYCVTRRELLSVVYFTKYYKTYLLGRPFMLRTDHAALQWLQRTPDPIGQQARWQERLSEFDFKVVHRPGKSHANADALSRRPDEEEVPLLVAAVRNGRVEPGTDICPVPVGSSLQAEQENDRFVSTVLGWMSVDWPRLEDILSEDEDVKTLWYQRNQLKIIDGVLYRQHPDGMRQLIVPKKLRSEFMRLTHSGITGGHLGIRRTRLQVRRRAYWPGWSKDVELFCRSCEVCCRYRQGKPPRQGKLEPLRCGAPWEILAVDVTGPHPTSSRGHVYILTLMDYFTKFVEAVPMRNQEASTIAQIIVERICAVYGCPLRLLSDRGPAFESQLFQEMCKLLGIEKIRTTSYEPRTNGMIERYHRTLNSMIGKVVDENHRNWHEILPFVAAAYRASVHECTGYSPNFLLFGRENRMPVDVVYGSPAEEDVRDETDYVQALRDLLQNAYALVRQNLGAAAKRRKHRYDLNVRVKKFTVGDEVWVFVPRKRRGRYPKWQKYYDGPYVILEQTGPLNFRVQKKPHGRSFVTHADKLLLRRSDEWNEPLETSADARGDCAPEAVADQGEPGDELLPRTPRPRRNIRRPARFAD